MRRYIGTLPIYQHLGKAFNATRCSRFRAYNQYHQELSHIPSIGETSGMPQAVARSVVELVLKITARTKGIPAMVQALATVMGQARLQSGYIECQLYAEISNPRSLLYLEQWETSQDFEVQVRSQRFAMLLAIVETAPEAPALKVRTIPEQHGLEYIANIRLASSATVSPTQGYAVAAGPQSTNPFPSINP